MSSLRFRFPTQLVQFRFPSLSRAPNTANDDEEMKLPDTPSLLIVLVGAQLLQIAFFILVPSSNEYSHHLGGTSTFAGLVIGIPVAFSALALYPMSRYDKGQYGRAIHMANASGVLGHVLYALGYRANYLYLILIGRITSGIAFTFFMYSKRYLSDPRLVGIRRRTTLASWLVVGQGVGFSAGPFFGGLLFKIGFGDRVWNGYTAPAWIIAGIWALYWVVSSIWFVDVAPVVKAESVPLQTTTVATGTTAEVRENEDEPMTLRQKAVIVCMCWYAMSCFFILGGWESNIPVYSSYPPFNYSPYAAGNFIALGGVATFPFLFLNVLYARRVQDRITLAIGSSLGMAGLIIMSVSVAVGQVHFANFFICWFLVALGFNLASTCTLSLLSKQLPGHWNGRLSMLIQYSNYTGRVTGAIAGGSGVAMGMNRYLGLQMGIVGVGMILHTLLWKDLKAKTG